MQMSDVMINNQQRDNRNEQHVVYWWYIYMLQNSVK